jgi:hypothetical protein
VAGASVWAAPVDNVGGAFSGRFPAVRARADDHGAFSLEGITAGTRYRITAAGDDETRGASDPFFVSSDAAHEGVTVRLQAAATLRMRLVDAQQRPAERIALRLDPGEEGDREGLARRQTFDRDSDKLVSKEDGWWVVRGLQPGVFDLRIEPDGYLGLRRSGIVLRGGEATDIGTLTLEPGASVRGRVVDDDDKPVHGAEVLARWRDMRGEYSRSSLSDDGGQFVVSGVPDHALTLEARADGFAPAVIEDAVAREELFVIAVDEYGTIHGRVQLAEGGVPSSFNARAVPRRRYGTAFGGPEAATADNTDDSFELDRLSPGTYTVEIRAPGRVTARIERVKVRPGETAEVGEVRLEKGLRLGGRILEGDGDLPVAGARIRADHGPGPASWSRDPADATTVSSRDGGFHVYGLLPTRYTFTIDHADFAPLQRSVVLDGEKPIDDVVFRLTNGGIVEGTVLDGNKAPVAGARVVVARFRDYDIRTTATGHDGRFRFAQLAPGSYMVIRTRAPSGGGFGNEMRTVEVQEGEATVVTFADR